MTLKLETMALSLREVTFRAWKISAETRASLLGKAAFEVEHPIEVGLGQDHQEVRASAADEDILAEISRELVVTVAAEKNVIVSPDVQHRLAACRCAAICFVVIAKVIEQ